MTMCKSWSCWAFCMGGVVFLTMCILQLPKVPGIRKEYIKCLGTAKNIITLLLLSKLCFQLNVKHYHLWHVQGRLGLFVMFSNKHAITWKFTVLFYIVLRITRIRKIYVSCHHCILFTQTEILSRGLFWKSYNVCYMGSSIYDVLIIFVQQYMMVVVIIRKFAVAVGVNLYTTYFHLMRCSAGLKIMNLLTSHSLFLPPK